MKYIIEIEEKPLCVFDKDTQTFFPRLWRVKGFNSLVFDEEGLSRLEELNSDYINEHYGDLQDEAYQRGFEDGKEVNDKGCEGCKYAVMGSDTTICGQCCNGYHNQWTAKQTDDEIKVGDEVRGINENEKLIITAIESEYDHCVVMTKRGGYYTANLSSLVKTGRHFDIASILKEMQS